jgi:hypothetical protein
LLALRPGLTAFASKYAQKKAGAAKSVSKKASTLFASFRACVRGFALLALIGHIPTEFRRLQHCGEYAQKKAGAAKSVSKKASMLFASFRACVRVLAS